MEKNKFLTNLFVGFLGVASLTPNVTHARSESMKEYASDAAIMAAMKEKIYPDPLINLFQVTVEKYEGIVILSGVVDTRQQAKRVKEIVESVDGVKTIRTNLVIKEDL